MRENALEIFMHASLVARSALIRGGDLTVSHNCGVLAAMCLRFAISVVASFFDLSIL